MKLPRFSLFSLFVAVTVAGALLWANIRQRIVVSNSPSGFGLPSLVSIHVLQGWPLAHTHTSYLVSIEHRDEFVADFPESAGFERPEVIYNVVAMNVGIGTLLIFVSGCVAECLTRRLGKFTSVKTAQSPRDSA